MTSSILPVVEAAGAGAIPPDFEDLAKGVFRVLESLQPDRSWLERRKVKRYPFPHPIQVTPVAPNGEILIAETTLALGKYISVLGLDFFHDQLLPHREIIVTMGSGTDRMGIMMQLTWCRFNRHSWYDSGGRFVRKVDPPLPE